MSVLSILTIPTKAYSASHLISKALHHTIELHSLYINLSQRLSIHSVTVQDCVCCPGSINSNCCFFVLKEQKALLNKYPILHWYWRTKQLITFVIYQGREAEDYSSTGIIISCNKTLKLVFCGILSYGSRIAQTFADEVT